MNSDFFKKEYRDAYQRFFSKNATVISLPFLINWSGDVFSNYQGFRIKQKIPFRSYIGVTRTKEPKISFDTITYFDFGEERFLTSNLLEYAPIFFEYENYFNKEYQAEIQKNGGIKIQIFSELSRGVGLGFVSVITLLFLLVLERIYGNLPIDQMKQLSELPPSEVLQAKTILNKLLSRTLEINRDLDRHISPEVQISAFFHSYYPIVSFTEDIPEHTEDINNVHMYGYRLNDIDPELPAIPYIPIDYGILYSGRPVLVDHIINTNDASFEWTEKIKDKLHKAFSKDVESLLPAQKPRFYKTFIEPEENVIKKAYWELMGSLSLETLSTMLRIYSNGYTESTMKNFIDVTNKIRWANYITRKTSNTFKDFITRIVTNFWSRSHVIGITPNDTTVMGGTATFVLPLEGYRKHLLDSAEATSTVFIWSRLLYANWMDGIESEGVCFEQDIENNIYSKYLGPESFLLRMLDGSVVLGDYESLLTKMMQGLLLDTIGSKIYLNGVRLTSKEIHSQSTTIEVLTALLVHPQKEIRNTELPVSSYSKNKNDMLGKIVLPLIKLLEEQKGIKFPLSCKGSPDDFFLKLGETSLEIGFLERL